MVQAQVGRTNAQDQPIQSDLAAADWKKNLKIGPNGPIPVIVVDQFGYLTKSKKVAVIGAPQIGYDSSASFSPRQRSEPDLKRYGQRARDYGMELGDRKPQCSLLQ